MRPAAFIQLVTLNAALGSLGAVAGEEASLPAESARALVLRNGNVLVGTVQAAPGGYDVSRDGAVLHAPEARVDYVASSILEVYERKRSEIDLASARDHLMLARWCLRYELWPQAAREIVDARGLDPHLAGLTFVEKQLAARSSAERKLVDTALPPAHSESEVADTGDEAVEQASDNLPSSVIVQFVRRVQPILVNNCTAVACHRTDGPSSFQLNRAVLHNETNRHTTGQNLMAALAWVDRAQPQASPLLRMSVRPHGGSEEPPLSQHRRELYQHLAQWVELVALEESVSAMSVEHPTPLPPAAAPPRNHPSVKRGAFGANHPRAQGRHGSPNVRFGLRMRKVDDPVPQSDSE